MPFTAAIIKRDFTTVYDYALKIGGASYLRALTYGGGWTRIRLGALVALTPNGASSISDGILAMGLCSGMDSPFSAYTTKSAIGFSFNGSPALGSTRTMTYTANAGFPYFAATSGVGYRKTTPGGIQVTVALGGCSVPLAYTGTVKRRFPIYVDITRGLGGSGTVTMTAYYVTAAAALALDFRPDHFQDGLDQIGTPTVYGQTLTASTTTANTLGVGDEFGPLDTFELWWSLNAFPLEVYALGAVVITPTRDTTTSLPYAGIGGAYQPFNQLTAATQITEFGTTGTGFTAAGTIISKNTGTNAVTGVSSGTLCIGLPGTSYGMPDDDFEQCSTGSVVSGVTLSFGTGWASYGTIY